MENYWLHISSRDYRISYTSGRPTGELIQTLDNLPTMTVNGLANRFDGQILACGIRGKECVCVGIDGAIAFSIHLWMLLPAL